MPDPPRAGQTTFLPPFLGISSENSAHRIAVEWEDQDGSPKEGVFVPRRDTNSVLNSLAGGRIFPGVHHHSQFEVHDQDGEISLTVTSEGESLVEVSAHESVTFPDDSIFGSLEESSRFFENGCVGYSSKPNSPRLDGLLLKVTDWRVTPLEVGSIFSSFFDNPDCFPPDQIAFDHALLMRDIPHEWHSEPTL